MIHLHNDCLIQVLQFLPEWLHVARFVSKDWNQLIMNDSLLRIEYFQTIKDGPIDWMFDWSDRRDPICIKWMFQQINTNSKTSTFNILVPVLMTNDLEFIQTIYQKHPHLFRSLSENGEGDVQIEIIMDHPSINDDVVNHILQSFRPDFFYNTDTQDIIRSTKRWKFWNHDFQPKHRTGQVDLVMDYISSQKILSIDQLLNQIHQFPQSVLACMRKSLSLDASLIHVWCSHLGDFKQNQTALLDHLCKNDFARLINVVLSYTKRFIRIDRFCNLTRSSMFMIPPNDHLIQWGLKNGILMQLLRSFDTKIPFVLIVQNELNEIYPNSSFAGTRLLDAFESELMDFVSKLNPGEMIEFLWNYIIVEPKIESWINRRTDAIKIDPLMLLQSKPHRVEWSYKSMRFFSRRLPKDHAEFIYLMQQQLNENQSILIDAFNACDFAFLDFCQSIEINSFKKILNQFISHYDKFNFTNIDQIDYIFESMIKDETTIDQVDVCRALSQNKNCFRIFHHILIKRYLDMDEIRHNSFFFKFGDNFLKFYE